MVGGPWCSGYAFLFFSCLVLVGYAFLLLQVAAQQCGKVQPRKQGLILGGTVSMSGRWPWHVALFHQQDVKNTQYKCGGTIINRDTVLTAYHCVAQGAGQISPARLQVRAGVFDLSDILRNVQIVKVFDVIAPSGANELDIVEDIAILKTATAFTYDSYVQPVCIRSVPQSIEQLVGEFGTVVGWGRTEENSTSATLREAKLPVVRMEDCLNSDRALFSQVLTTKLYCAGSRNGTSSCNGDSGGGMFFQMDGYWFLRGITSFSSSNAQTTVCNPFGYAGYTDVSKYLDWLRQLNVMFQDPLENQQPATGSVVSIPLNSNGLLHDWFRDQSTQPEDSGEDSSDNGKPALIEPGRTTRLQLSVDPATRKLLQNNEVVLKVPLNGRSVESLFTEMADV